MNWILLAVIICITAIGIRHRSTLVFTVAIAVDLLCALLVWATTKRLDTLMGIIETRRGEVDKLAQETRREETDKLAADMPLTSIVVQDDMPSWTCLETSLQEGGLSIT